MLFFKLASAKYEGVVILIFLNRGKSQTPIKRKNNS